MTVETLQPIAGTPVPTGAVAWLNGHVATVVTTDPDRGVSTVDVAHGVEPEAAYLAHVVHAIGDRDRVLILGPSSQRLALEREYVAVFKRPDRLVDVELAGPTGTQDLIDRLRTLVA